MESLRRNESTSSYKPGDELIELFYKVLCVDSVGQYIFAGGENSDVLWDYRVSNVLPGSGTDRLLGSRVSGQ